LLLLDAPGGCMMVPVLVMLVGHGGGDLSAF
jgi:hypothetical protein